jgi:DNA polymerase-3 subunit delta'
MSWKSIIGQQRVKQLLLTSLEQKRLAHAYLFAGVEGVGKYPVALELAKCVNCRTSPYDACDSCPSCQSMKELQHPNLHLVFPLPRGKNEEPYDAPLAKLSEADMNVLKAELKHKADDPYHRIRLERASEIKVNSIREVRRQAAFTSFDVGRKAFLILDADKMNAESANALLKTLEEPTQDTLFILITTRQEALLPTIVSRCQVIKFDPLTENDIISGLTERYQIPAKDAAIAARTANGSFIRALRYIEPGAVERKETAVNFLRTLLSRSRKDVNELIFNLFSEYERRDFTEMFLLLQQWFRDAMRIREGASDGNEMPDMEPLMRFNVSFPSWRYAETIDVLERSISLLDKNVYIPLILINTANDLRRTIGEMKVN